MENMKIGIDCHNLEGQRTGVGRYLWNLLREWSSTGTVLGDTEFFLYFKREIPEDVQELFDVRGETPHIRNLRGGSNAIFKHWLLPRAVRRDKIDVLFCPDYVLPLYVGDRTPHIRDGRIRTAVTIHDIIYEARPEGYSWPSWKDKILLRWASKQSAKRADVIFTPSEFTKSEILKYYKVNPEKVLVTPLAPDPIFNPSGSDPDGLKRVGKEYGINGAYIFFVGSIFSRRFLPQCIQGFAQFARDNKDFSPYGRSPAGGQFLIVGKNHTQPFLDIGTLIAETNTKLGREAIVWRERAADEDLVSLYNGAFATLWLSSYEGFGLPVLESMACGTPVITTSMGSLREVAGDAAMYVTRPENPSEIAKALTHLVRNDSYRRDLISKGLARAAQFSWQKCARDTVGNILRL